MSTELSKYKQALEIVNDVKYQEAENTIKAYEKKQEEKRKLEKKQKVERLRKEGCKHPNSYVSEWHQNGEPDYWYCDDCESYC